MEVVWLFYEIIFADSPRPVRDTTAEMLKPSVQPAAIFDNDVGYKAAVMNAFFERDQ